MTCSIRKILVPQCFPKATDITILQLFIAFENTEPKMVKFILLFLLLGISAISDAAAGSVDTVTI